MFLSVECQLKVLLCKSFLQNVDFQIRRKQFHIFLFFIVLNNFLKSDFFTIAFMSKRIAKTWNQTVNTLRLMVLKSIFVTDLLAPIFGVDAIVLHTNDIQQLFSHLAKFYWNCEATGTLFILQFAVLTDQVKFQASIPLLFFGPRMPFADLTNQLISNFSQSFTWVFEKRCHFDLTNFLNACKIQFEARIEDWEIFETQPKSKLSRNFLHICAFPSYRRCGALSRRAYVRQPVHFDGQNRSKQSSDTAQDGNAILQPDSTPSQKWGLRSSVSRIRWFRCSRWTTFKSTSAASKIHWLHNSLQIAHAQLHQFGVGSSTKYPSKIGLQWGIDTQYPTPNFTQKNALFGPVSNVES